MKLSLTVIVLFILSLYFKSSTSTNTNEAEEKREPNQYAPIWFGPRIGRKKRNLVDDGQSNMDPQEVEVLLDFLRRSPWSIMMFGNGKSRLMNFKPKEGRSLSENFNDDEITEMVQRSMFAPRLGRAMKFISRLGRDVDMME